MQNMTRRAGMALAACVAIATGVAFADEDGANPPKRIFAETQEEHDARMAWWTHDRFGMFIHFGLYSVPGRHEWVQSIEATPTEQYDRECVFCMYSDSRHDSSV